MRNNKSLAGINQEKHTTLKIMHYRKWSWRYGSENINRDQENVWPAISKPTSCPVFDVPLKDGFRWFWHIS